MFIKKTSSHDAILRRIFNHRPEGAVNLAIGEPDYRPPDHVLSTLSDHVPTGYSHSKGFLALREAIIRYHHPLTEELKPDNVVVTCGASEALLSTFSALFDKGDQVLIPDPGFPLFRVQLELIGAKPVSYPLQEENRYRPDLDAISDKITSSTKGIVMNYPSNPTGSVLNEDDVCAILDLAEDHDLLIISDEVYHRIVYDDSASFLGRSDRVVYINSLSKTYAMTGFRIGYLIASEDVVEPISTFHQCAVACPPTPLQVSALKALSTPENWIQDVVRDLRRRRDLAVDMLRDAGLDVHTPSGTFYLFPSYVEITDQPSLEICDMLIESGVLVMPGRVFGPLGEGHIRISYATDEEKIREGIKRLSRALGG